MKIPNKVTLFGSLAVLSAAPIAFADEATFEPEIAVCWEGPADFLGKPIIIVGPDVDDVTIDPIFVDEETIVEEEPYSEEETYEEEVTFEDEETYEEEVTFEDEETYEEEETFEEEVAYEEEEITDGEVVEVTDGGEVEDYPEIAECGNGFEIPLDWIKRGGGENPEIYYSVTSFGGPVLTPTAVFKGQETTPIARQIGPDSKATAIEGSANPGAFQADRDKKGPVALVKKGRVFLR